MKIMTILGALTTWAVAIYVYISGRRELREAWAEVSSERAKLARLKELVGER